MPVLPDVRFISDDPVEEWKRHARASTSERSGRGNGNPILRLQVTLGFVSVGLVVGSIDGFVGAVTIIFVLASVILAHELPRALFARALGRSSTVRVAATGSDTHVSGPTFRGAASFVFRNIGSAVNVAVASVVFAVARRSAGPHLVLVSGLGVPHAVWGAAQCLPLVPFRNGATVARRFRPPQRLAFAIASALVVVSIAALSAHWMSAPALFGVSVLIVVASGSALLESHRENRDFTSGVDNTVHLAQVALAAGDYSRASELIRNALVEVRSSSERAKLHELLAWAAIGKGDPFLAHGALLELPPSAIDLRLLASYLSACNRIDEAIELLEEASSLAHRSSEDTQLLADLLFRRGERAALALTTSAQPEPSFLPPRNAAHSRPYRPRIRAHAGAWHRFGLARGAKPQ